MQVQMEAVAGATMRIGFEQVVFERVGTTVVVSVSGMTAGCDPELMVFETEHRVSVSVIGSPVCGDQREYTAMVRLGISEATLIVVCGEFGSERVKASDLPDELPVVCTADPTSMALPTTFLHRRGQRYVLMGRADAPHEAHAVA